MLKKLLSAAFVHYGCVAFASLPWRTSAPARTKSSLCTIRFTCWAPTTTEGFTPHHSQEEAEFVLPFRRLGSLKASGGSGTGGGRAGGGERCVTRGETEGKPGEARRQEHLRHRVGVGEEGQGRVEEALRHVVCACGERWPPIIWGL